MTGVPPTVEASILRSRLVASSALSASAIAETAISASRGSINRRIERPLPHLQRGGAGAGAGVRSMPPRTDSKITLARSAQASQSTLRLSATL